MMGGAEDPGLSLRERDLAARGLMLLEGAHLVERAARAGIALTDIHCVPAAVEAAKAWVGAGTSLRVLPEAEISLLAGYPFHRGVLALGRRPFPVSLEEMGERATGKSIILCLWEIADPLNAGAIARSALAFGAAGLALGPGCADMFCAKALRSSMGATLILPICGLPPEPKEAARAFSRWGFETLAAARLADSLTPAQAFAGAGREKPRVVFLGNEGRGLPDELSLGCDLRLWIPHFEGADSLNVAAAAAVLLWEISGRGSADTSRAS
jgi:tRNA G18 (ribose-2'-O)-methylase SpoU